MSTTDRHFFERAFLALTGKAPFPWQQELFNRLVAGEDNWPRTCDIPTGLGKTAVIAIWLIALAYSVKERVASLRIPRRLVYVVNRRTVVDQSTGEAESLRQRLNIEGELSDEDRAVLQELQQLLRTLCSRDDTEVLAISTLRGQFADNREWSADPARPAIIVGTVDMIGSRLLFSGYGVGFKAKPLHAGFLGQDVLLIHDEAHLEPAFQKLLVTIQKEQQRCNEFSAFHVMALTATSRQEDEPPQASAGQEASIGLTDQEKNPPAVIPDPPTEPIHHLWRRITASKAIRLVRVEDEKRQLVPKIAELALKFKDSQQAILVFARTVEAVETIAQELAKKGLAVQRLTGTMRGLERDRLPSDPVFARFLPRANRPEGILPTDGTAYLVCTSAGEVGVNISADHLVCDLTTFESMAQRFGRVNRFGARHDTEIHVVYSEEFEKNVYEDRRRKTLELLQQLKGNGSPISLGKLDSKARSAAFVPEPTILPATDILFDAWALTTIRDQMPGRPPVSPYLHGLAEWELPETQVAWREEVGIVTGALLDRYAPEDLLDDYPLKPHELLRDRSNRVLKHLAVMAEYRADTPAWLIDDNGHIELLTLRELADDVNKTRINYRTILLPPEAGGLRDGLLDGSSEFASDVADEWFADKEKTARRRIRLWDDEPVPSGMRPIRVIDARADADDLQEEAQTPTRRYWQWYELARAGETDGSRAAIKPVRWQDHTDQVVANAEAIANRLELPQEVKQALRLAARFHDLGKRREVWQRSIGNPNPTDWHAKSGRDPITGRAWKPRGICPDYRHEFGSLLDSQGVHDLRELSDQSRCLVLHLIAASHGRGRPHFPTKEVFDPESTMQDLTAVATEVARRFARLQHEYGRWGLAYLESLLRAADWAASTESSQTKPTTKEAPE